ncbi:hypothetical protein EVJ58_g1091 [Rhodofomes roseus]|uniref:Uncharacterized protein n=1 Tax=Rhodofomes roseus TaxID=34475 RepID=A0A4Y9Z1A1_9APHY|nr:hypothetical protein EVJ58_g1091 [Rhodofomes roseus]
MQAQVSKPSYAAVVKYRKPAIQRRRAAIPIAAPTPEREADTDFAAILGQDWELYEGEVRLVSKQDSAESERQTDVEYTTWPPVLSARSTVSSRLPVVAYDSSMLPPNQEHGAPRLESNIQYTSWPPVLSAQATASGLPLDAAYQSSMLSPIHEHGDLATTAYDARSMIMPIITAGGARPPLNVATADLPGQGPSTDTGSPASSNTLSSPLDGWEPIATSTPLPKWTWVARED